MDKKGLVILSILILSFIPITLVQGAYTYDYEYVPVLFTGDDAQFLIQQEDLYDDMTQLYIETGSYSSYVTLRFRNVNFTRVGYTLEEIGLNYTVNSVMYDYTDWALNIGFEFRQGSDIITETYLGFIDYKDNAIKSWRYIPNEYFENQGSAVNESKQITLLTGDYARDFVQGDIQLVLTSEHQFRSLGLDAMESGNVPQLVLKWRQNIDGTYQGEYGGYDIYKQTTDNESFSGFIWKNSGANEAWMCYINDSVSASWDVVQLPANYEIASNGDMEHGYALGDKLYLLLYNSTDTNGYLWSTPLDDIGTFTYLAQAFPNQPATYQLVYNEAENTFYIYCLQATGGDLRRYKYFLDNSSISASYTLLIDSSYVGSSIDAVYDGIDSIIVACSTADTTGSANHLYIGQDSISGWTLWNKTSTAYVTPTITLFDGGYMIYATVSNNIYYIQGTALQSAPGGAVLSGSSGSMTRQVGVYGELNRAYLAYPDVSNPKEIDFIYYDSDLVKTAGTNTANYSTHLQYTGNVWYEGTPHYIMVANDGYVFLFDNPSAQLAGAGVSYTWTDFWSHYWTGADITNPYYISTIGSEITLGGTLYVAYDDDGVSPFNSTTLNGLKDLIDNLKYDQSDDYYTTARYFDIFGLIGLVGFFAGFPLIPFAWKTRGLETVGLIILWEFICLALVQGWVMTVV